MFRIRGGMRFFYLNFNKLDVWVQSGGLENPNGLLADEERLIVAGLGKVIDPDVMGSIEYPGHVKQISFADKQLSSLGDGTPIGILDGVAADGKGHWL